MEGKNIGQGTLVKVDDDDDGSNFTTVQIVKDNDKE